MPTQGLETAKTKKINIVKADELKGDPPENQEILQQKLVNYKAKLLKLHQDINAKQIELDRLRFQTNNQTKDVFDAIADLKAQESDIMTNRRELFLRLSDN